MKYASYRRAEDKRVINRVKEYRVAKSLTQQQLADMVHVSSRTIISIETGQYNPSLLLAYRISLVLDCPIRELYSLDQNLQEEDSAQATRDAKKSKEKR